MVKVCIHIEGKTNSSAKICPQGFYLHWVTISGNVKAVRAGLAGKVKAGTVHNSRIEGGFGFEDQKHSCKETE